jgi:hypothetical protein
MKTTPKGSEDKFQKTLDKVPEFQSSYDVVHQFGSKDVTLWGE